MADTKTKLKHSERWRKLLFEMPRCCESQGRTSNPWLL